jgi:chaperonin GroEL (HSP60 family)
MGREGEITVTNDGATILKAIHVDNPAARILIGNQISLSA